MPRRDRFFLAGLLGIMSAMINFIYQSYIFENPPDFTWPMIAGRAFLSGQEPYNPSLYPYESLFYPLTTVIFAAPFSVFSENVGSALFFGFSSALAAYFLLQKYEPWRLFMFLSAPYYEAIRTTQWSPLLMLVALLPSMLPFVLIRPQLALSLVLADYRKHFTRRAIAVTALMLLLSFIAKPLWPVAWLGEVDYSGKAPLFVWPLGPLLLLALLRWREYEGRLLFCMALLPKRVFYDQLVLWLIPRNPYEMAFLTLASWVGYIAWFLSKDWLNWPLWMVGALYLPALAVLLYPLLLGWVQKRLAPSSS